MKRLTTHKDFVKLQRRRNFWIKQLECGKVCLVSAKFTRLQLAVNDGDVFVGRRKIEKVRARIIAALQQNGDVVVGALKQSCRRVYTRIQASSKPERCATACPFR